MRRRVVLVLGSLALVAPARAHDVPFFWSVEKVMRVTDQTRVRVGAKVVRLHAETMLCGGQGIWTRRRSVRRWRHFACTYTTFINGKPDRDLEFRVHVLGIRRFVITDARWVRESP